MTGADAPFFALSGLDMRGFSRSRYLDQHSVSVHGELRYFFLPRWEVIGFTEFGRLGQDLDDILSNRTIYSYGGGIQWQVLKEKKMNFGVSAAFSEDERTLFFQIGESF